MSWKMTLDGALSVVTDTFGDALPVVLPDGRALTLKGILNLHDRVWRNDGELQIQVTAVTLKVGLASLEAVDLPKGLPRATVINGAWRVDAPPDCGDRWQTYVLSEG